MTCSQHARAICAVAVLGLVLSGCGDGNRATVTGRVRFGGQPLERGSVVFHPSGSDPTAIGTIQSDSTYTLATGRSPGLVPGEYRVTVQSREPVILPTDNRSGPKPGNRITPELYGDVSSTPLSFTVLPGSNVIDIDIDLERPK